jgi:hypothetical protein
MKKLYKKITCINKLEHQIEMYKSIIKNSNQEHKIAISKLHQECIDYKVMLNKYELNNLKTEIKND